MSETPKFGDFIRQLRMEKGIGLREAARKMGFSTTYLSRIESEKDKASGKLLVEMASLYEISLEQLTKKASTYKSSTAAHGQAMQSSAELRALYRVGKLLNSEEVDDLLRGLVKKLNSTHSDDEVDEEIRKLKDELPRLSKGQDGLFATRIRRRFLSRKQIEELAEEVLLESGVDTASYVPPTDVERIVDMQPDIVYRVDELKCKKDGEPIVLGLTGWNQSGKKEIVINGSLADGTSRTDASRFSFTLAHELFHAIEHLPRTNVGSEQVLMRLGMMMEIFSELPEKTSKAERAVSAWANCGRPARKLVTEEDWREWQANSFASALLMPEAAVRREFERRVGQSDVVASDNPRDLALSLAGETLFDSAIYADSMAETFAVSRQAMAVRFLSLGLVKEG